MSKEFRVRLVSILAMRSSATKQSIDDAQVIFEVTPVLTESGSVEYGSTTPVHMPGSIQIYKHTSSRSFDIQAKFISRNVADAVKNMKYLQTMRSWRYPFFGATDTIGKTSRDMPAESDEPVSNPDDAAVARAKDTGAQLKGAPPEVLYLYAYASGEQNATGDGSASQPINLSRIPVVLTSLTITYDSDVDYIPVYTGSDASTAVPFPMRVNVSLMLAETHSPREYEKFDLMAYKKGNLTGF